MLYYKFKSDCQIITDSILNIFEENLVTSFNRVYKNNILKEIYKFEPIIIPANDNDPRGLSKFLPMLMYNIGPLIDIDTLCLKPYVYIIDKPYITSIDYDLLLVRGKDNVPFSSWFFDWKNSSLLREVVTYCLIMRPWVVTHQTYWCQNGDQGLLEYLYNLTYEIIFKTWNPVYFHILCPNLYVQVINLNKRTDKKVFNTYVEEDTEKYFFHLAGRKIDKVQRYNEYIKDMNLRKIE